MKPHRPEILYNKDKEDLVAMIKFIDLDLGFMVQKFWQALVSFPVMALIMWTHSKNVIFMAIHLAISMLAAWWLARLSAGRFVSLYLAASDIYLPLEARQENYHENYVSGKRKTPDDDFWLTSVNISEVFSYPYAKSAADRKSGIRRLWILCMIALIIPAFFPLNFATPAHPVSFLPAGIVSFMFIYTCYYSMLYFAWDFEHKPLLRKKLKNL